jgi:hypothetical protein
MSYFRITRLSFSEDGWSAYKELPHLQSANGYRGQEWIRTTEVERQRIYSPPHLAALEPALLNGVSTIYASISMKNKVWSAMQKVILLRTSSLYLCTFSEPLVGIEPTTY